MEICWCFVMRRSPWLIASPAIEATTPSPIAEAHSGDAIIKRQVTCSAREGNSRHAAKSHSASCKGLSRLTRDFDGSALQDVRAKPTVLISATVSSPHSWEENVSRDEVKVVRRTFCFG